MKILDKKLYRDIKNNMSQFITIFLMVFLGVFVFAGIHSYMDGMSQSGNDYYEKQNLQDIWLSGENFTDDHLKKVKEIVNVQDAERVLTINTELQGLEDVTLQANFIETNNISKMYVVDGEGYKEGDKRSMVR